MGLPEVGIDCYPLAIVVEEIKPVVPSGKEEGGKQDGLRGWMDGWLLLDCSFMSQKSELYLSKASRDECLGFQ